MSWLSHLFTSANASSFTALAPPAAMPAPTSGPPCQHPRMSGPPVTSSMFAVDRGKLDPQLAAAFVQSERDVATNLFLADATRDGCDKAKLLQNRKDRQKFLAAQRQGMSRHDASAAHQNLTLHVASIEQFRRVLAPVRAGALEVLDIGAGRGEATTALASALGVPAERVTIMERGAAIRQKCTERGFRAVAGFGELGAGARFGAVALLNVLDRCDDPVGLLRAAVNAMRPDGLLLVATVLPFCARVYEGVKGKTGANRPPTHPIHLPPSLRCPMIKLGKDGDRFIVDESVPFHFERHVGGFLGATIRRVPGLRVAAWTRVPYLATGTVEHTYYHLENALFVLRRTQEGPTKQQLKAKVDEIRLSPS